jgi:hypothetical protein
MDLQPKEILGHSRVVKNEIESFQVLVDNEILEGLRLVFARDFLRDKRFKMSRGREAFAFYGLGFPDAPVRRDGNTLVVVSVPDNQVAVDFLFRLLGKSL